MLEFIDVSVCFHSGTADEKMALEHVSLRIEDGDFICVLGTNGAGKSTLLNVISGAIPVTSGKILLDGEDITHLPEHKRARAIGRLFQDPLKGTAPNMTIEENLGLAYSRGKRAGFHRAIKKKDRRFFIEKLLTLLMATIVTPKLLLLDEHTAALDPKTAASIMEISEEIIKQHQITTLMITHNISQALLYGNKTIILNEGKIVKVLEKEERKQTSVEDLLAMYDFV